MTSAVITLELKDSDIGKTISFSVNGTKYETVLNNKFISITNNADSHVRTLGEVLVTKYNTYDKVLELISQGDCSFVGNPYATRVSENWDYNKPIQTDTETVDYAEDLFYLFRDNQWFVRKDIKEDFVSVNCILNPKGANEEVEDDKSSTIEVERSFLETLDGYLLGISSAFNLDTACMRDKIEELLNKN